jgi:hypothetical protein
MKFLNPFYLLSRLVVNAIGIAFLALYGWAFLWLGYHSHDNLLARPIVGAIVGDEESPLHGSKENDSSFEFLLKWLLQR